VTPVVRRNVLLIATLLAAAAFLGWLAWVTPSESPAAHTAASPPAPQPAAVVASGFAAAPAAATAAQSTVPVVGTAAAVGSAEVQEAVEQRQDAKITRGMSSNPQGGIRIDATPPGSVAEQMQLLPGDVLVAVNGAAISSPEQFARIYRSPGVQGEFVVIRDGREIHRR
jgi:membrane-associated protease RseP (regulator of RpoE activity)